MVNVNNEKYLLPVGDSDFRRMTMLGEIYKPYCDSFLFENGLARGLQVADVGCGPGNYSLWLAEQVGVTGKVTAIDNNDEQLTILRQKILEQNITQVVTHKTDIYEIDQIKERFDIIFCRFLFIHLSDPLLAIQKIHTLLKPGGRLIICDLDNSTWFSYPESKVMQKSTELLCNLGIHNKSDFCIGPKLFGYLRKENFTAVNVKIAQPILTSTDREYLILRCKALANNYIEYNLISLKELEKMISDLYYLINNDDYLLAAAKMYLTCGRKS